MGWLVDAVGLLSKGGLVMIPLMVCSIVSVAILVERFVRVKQAQTDISSSISKVEDAIYKGNSLKALELLDKCETPVGRVLSAGIRSRHLGERGTERAMEEQGTREACALTNKLGYLDTIITIAPLLGLLGTVTGMISAFHVIATKNGISTPTAITGGVAEALIATATGLAIAIITLVGYNHIQERIKGIVADMEARGSAMVNILVESSEVSNEIKSLSA
jgi:biopolymer transport protein ExbB